MQPIPPSAKAVHTGKIFTTYQWPQRQFDNSIVTFEAVRRADSVNVLPVTAEGKIMLTKQEQPGMPPFISALGGKVDPGETPRQAGERELLEEAGLQAKSLTLWHASQISMYIDWACWTYIAHGCTKVADPTPDQGEKIELIEVTFEEYLTIVTEPVYRDKDVAFELMRKQARGEIEQVKNEWFGRATEKA